MKHAPIKLIVGLGNPGTSHRLDRHNVGFWFVDALAQRVGGNFRAEHKFQGEACRIELEGHELRLLKPTTYMNRSGLSVQALSSYLHIQPEQILVAAISEKHSGYAREIHRMLLQRGLRSALGDCNRSLAKQLREAHELGIPRVFVVGAREEESRSVSVRTPKRSRRWPRVHPALPSATIRAPTRVGWSSSPAA